MYPCLVVYYSRTGITAKVAREIASQCGAAIDVVREERSRAGRLGIARSILDSVTHRRPAICPAEKDPSDYDTVILGTPVWAGHMSAPIRSYLERYRDRLRRVGLFCTMGGADGQHALDEMAALAGKRPFAALALTDVDIQQGNHVGRLDALTAGGLALVR
jgi:flavodoxin